MKSFGTYISKHLASFAATGLLIFLIAIPVVIIGGILAALAGRMKEIEGGEEDEASKY